MSRESINALANDVKALVQNIRQHSIDGNELEIDRISEVVSELLDEADNTKPKREAPTSAEERENQINADIQRDKRKCKDPFNRELISLVGWIADSLLRPPKDTDVAIAMAARNRSLEHLDILADALLGRRPIDFSFLVDPLDMWRTAEWIHARAKHLNSDRLRKAASRGELQTKKRDDGKNLYYIKDVVRCYEDEQGNLRKQMLAKPRRP